VTPVNDAPSAVILSNVRATLAENISTASAIKVADIAITDVDGAQTIFRCRVSMRRFSGSLEMRYS